jgi:limonene-1,2-epoxide hydrolase
MDSSTTRDKQVQPDWWPTKTRRHLLGSSGAAMVAGFTGMGSLWVNQSRAQPAGEALINSAQEAANLAIVAGFCEAWSSLDLRQVVAFMSEDAVYRMTEETPPAIGHQALINQMQPWVDTSSAIEFRIVDSWARGPLVMNHRIDIFSSDTRPLIWEGVGTFLIREGKIREWSDFTIRVERFEA